MLSETPSGNRPFVAVSGGVDSLLALCLLQEEGRSPEALHGFFLPPGEREIALRDELASVCSRLGVPLHTYDFSEAFHSRVITPFVEEYARGVTPNPCALCNRRIKFGLLLDAARELGGDALATGHYARVTAEPALYRGLDPAKEQSYFLALLTREQIAQAIFPLGTWYKEETRRALHSRVGPPPASGESQEVCFIPDNDYRRFVRERVEDLPGPGPIRDSSGRSLGEHSGLYRYTLGQRRGLGIPSSEPLYVLKKDLETNTLIVGTRDELGARGCTVREMNYLLQPQDWPETVYVQGNYRQEPRMAETVLSGDRAEVRFPRPAQPPTPGQVMAFYNEDGRVLGGGIISE
jgi:tRNA-specific 2-thiouridylase